MAITTDRHINIHGVSVGVSKPIQTLIANGDFTFAELSKFAFVGRYDFVNDACAVYDNDNNEYGQSAQLLTKDKYPILNDPTKPWDTIWYQYHGSVGRTAATYGKMILLYNFNDARSTIKNDFTDDNTACVVTELNPRLLKMTPNVTLSTITASLGEPGTYTTYDVETTINISWFDDDSASPFRPLCVSQLDSHDYFFFPLYNNTLHARQNIAGNTDGTNAQLIDLQDAFDNNGDAYLSPWASSAPILDFCPGHDYGTTFIGAYTLNTERADRLLILDYHGAWDFNGNLQVKASSLDTALKQCAACGLYFVVNGITYKPLSSGGVVTGYTTDLDKNGEWDLINDVTGNTIPDTPGGGGGEGANGDELTDMLSRGQFYGSGLTKYYVDPPASKLQKALGNWDNIKTGKDVLQNLLSYKILCFPSTTFSNGMTEPFVIAGSELKDESDNTITAKRLTSTGAVDLPAITITPTFNDFRDYAPYTKIQMFVPLCGWFDLPPWCMGRRITGEMYINPYSGTCRCLVRADGNVVAELGGNASIDLPFNATAVGMKSAAVLSNLIQTAGAVGSAVMLPTVNTLAGAGSAALGAICAMNANYTESKGTMGDGSNVYGLYHVYIKITRPATVDTAGNNLVQIPAQYCRDYGRPCNKQLKLAAGDGYTQIMDANITGAMTDREKQMIIDGFRHGLIL